MPVPVFAQVLLAVLFVGSVAAVTFWNKILNWASKILIPWIEKNLPWLADNVKDAFLALDDVVTSVRRNIKKAWENLREYLLKVLVQYEQNTQNEWIKRITYWAIPILQNKSEVVRVVAEQKVDIDSLPDDVREEWLKRGNTTQDIDVTQLRDRELELAPMTN
jgi:hypothetical protein